MILVSGSQRTKISRTFSWKYCTQITEVIYVDVNKLLSKDSKICVKVNLLLLYLG
jgi:hypothetical protein